MRATLFTPLVRVSVGLLVAACTVKDPLFCDDTHPCVDPARPYCDRTGQYDLPDHLRNSCVASPTGVLSVDVGANRNFLRRDGSISIPVQITRNSGVEGAVAVVVDAPPSGVTFDPLSIPAGSDIGTLVAHAAGDAPYARTNVDVKGDLSGAVAQDGLDLEVIGKPGDLDTTFGGGQVGLVAGSPARIFAQGERVVVVQTATRTGKQGVLASRVLPDGGIDPSFGAAGTYFDDFSASGVSNVSPVAAVQSSGKIIIAGSGTNGGNRDPVIVRLTADEQVDPSLQPHRLDAAATDDAYSAISIDAQDEIYLAGTTGPSNNRDVVIMRATQDGQPDLSFAAGRATFGTSANEIVYRVTSQTDRGAIVDWGACGQFSCGSALRRYDSTGTHDTTFGAAGDLSPKENYGVASVAGVGFADGTGFVAWGTGSGSQPPAMAVWRFLSNSQLDAQFGTSGLYEAPADARSHGVADAVELPDGSGRLYVGWDVGSTIGSTDYHLSVLKLGLDGGVDTSVGSGGVMRDAVVVFLPASAAVRDDHRFAVLGALDPSSGGQLVVRTYFW